MFGITIRVHWTAPVLVAVLGYSLGGVTLPLWTPGHSAFSYSVAGGIGTLALLLSLLAHEMAHALVARRAGVEVHEVMLWALGGWTNMEKAPTPRTLLAITLSGPITSIVLGLIALGTTAAGVGFGLRPLQHSGWAVAGATVLWLGLANTVLGICNLLPGAPLDGGYMVEAVVWGRTGDRSQAEGFADRGGQAVGLVIVALGVVLLVRGMLDSIWLVVLGIFMAVTAEVEGRRHAGRIQLRGMRAADAMSAPVQSVSDQLTIHQFIQKGGQHIQRSRIALVDHKGRPTGLVSLHKVAFVPVKSRKTMRLRDVGVPLDQCQVAAPRDPLLKALDSLGTANVKLLVIDDERLLGIITDHDVIRLIQRGGRPPPFGSTR